MSDLMEGRPKCKAQAKSTGRRCTRPPVAGGTVCHIHGGGAPQVRAAAARRVATMKVEAEVSAALAHEALGPVENPLDALAHLAAEALAMKRALAARVNALNDIRYEGGAGTEQLRAEVVLYERAMDRAGRFLDLLAKSGIEERRVRLAEDQGLLVAGVIRRILDRLALTAEQQLLVPQVVPAELRALEGAPA